jgi:hypothetical protein
MNAISDTMPRRTKAYGNCRESALVQPGTAESRTNMLFALVAAFATVAACGDEVGDTGILHLSPSFSLAKGNYGATFVHSSGVKACLVNEPDVFGLTFDFEPAIHEPGCLVISSNFAIFSTSVTLSAKEIERMPEWRLCTAAEAGKAAEARQIGTCRIVVP